MNPFEILFALIEVPLESPALYRVTEALGDAVKACSDAIEKAATSQNFEHFDSVAADESTVMESLIGAAFVACQAEINGAAAHFVRIHEEAKQAGVILKTSDGSKPGTRAVGSPKVGTSRYTRIEVINAFANYFKHRDEWKRPWDEAIDDQRWTVSVISEVGAKEFESENLRTGLGALGIHPEMQMGLLSNFVHEWIDTMQRNYMAELKTHGLL